MDPKTKELVTALHGAPDRPGALEAVRQHMMGIGKPMSLVKLLEWWSGKTSNPAAAAAVLVEAAQLTLDHSDELARAQKQIQDSIELDPLVAEIAGLIDRAFEDDPRGRLQLLAHRIELMREKKASPSVRSEAYAHYGKTLAAMGRVDKALEILEPLAARRDDAADLVVRLLVHRAQKQPGTAARDRKRAVQVLRAHARRAPDQASDLLMRALQIEPADEAALRELETVADPEEMIPYWDAFLAQTTGAPADRVTVKLAQARAETGDVLAAVALLEPLASRLAEARNELERLRSHSRDASRVALLAELEEDFRGGATRTGKTGKKAADVASKAADVDSELDALFDDEDETAVGNISSSLQASARRSSSPPPLHKSALPALKPGSIPPPAPRISPRREPLHIPSEPIPSAAVPAVAPMSVPPDAFEAFDSLAQADDPPTDPVAKLKLRERPDREELDEARTEIAEKRTPAPDDFFRPPSGEIVLPKPAPVPEPEPRGARASTRPPRVPRAAELDSPPGVPLRREEVTFEPSELRPFGDDDEDDDEPMISVDPARIVSAGEDAHDGPFTLEIVRLAGDTVHAAQVLRRFQRLKDASFPGTIRISGDVATVRIDRETDGVVLTKANGATESLGTSPTSVDLRSGARLEVRRDSLRWLLRGGHSLVSSGQRAQPRDLRTHAVGAAIAIGVHLLFGASVEMLSAVGGVNLAVDTRPPEEIFAEARIQRPERPRPPPRPRPPRVQREKAPPPRETRTTLSKTLRNRVQQLQRNTRATNDTERLVERLTTPNAGEAQSITEVVTSIDGVASTAHIAGTAGITGSLQGVEGIQVATQAGGANIGVLGGTDAASMVDMLQKRSGPVRGRVSSVSALARTTGGSLSRGEIQAVLNRAQGQIMRCYERALLSNPNLSGRIQYLWTIQPNGRVSGVREQSSTLGNPGVGTCVAGVLRGLRFPQPQGGSVEVSYPFMFTLQ